jgi:hypothetical protein
MNILREKQRLLPLGNPQGGGSGGGGGGTSQQTTTTELPEWARPYAKDILAKGQALTDTSQNPYQTYNAPRIAGFSPMQEQAFQGAANLAPSQAGGAGQMLAAGAGIGAMNQGMFGGREAAQYMNPYLQQSLAPQIELMRQQQAQQGAQMAGQATQAGAFGGSRFGLAQAQQNLNNQLAQQNLIGQGYNTAYQQAAQQYNADQARRLQGLQTGLQAAGTLGQLGAQEFGQQQAAIGLQGQMGAQQQQLQQLGLDQAYQEFLNQQNYPYKQLGFMSDLLRGTPTGSSSAMNMYQAPGSVLGQLGGIGMGMYGLSKMGMFKEGGEVKGYAKGGELDLELLSDDQLQQSYKNALSRGEIGLAQAIQEQLATNTAIRNAENASIQVGLGSAFDQLSPEMQDNVIQAAGGGIVAFAGDKKSDVKEGWEYSAAGEEDPRTFSEANPGLAEFLAGSNKATKDIGDKFRRALTYNSDVEAAKERAKNIPLAKDIAPSTAGAGRGKVNPPVVVPREEEPVKAETKKEASSAAAPAKSISDALASKKFDQNAVFKEMMSMLHDPESAKLLQQNADEIKKYSERAEKLKETRGAEALAQYGFQMAAEASKPGARFLGSAAAASPVIMKSLAASKEIEQKMADNAMRMRQLQNQSIIAMRKGDRQTAVQLTNMMRQFEQQQQQLALQQQQLQETQRYHTESLAVQRERIASGDRGYQSALLRTKGNLSVNAMKQAAKDWGDPLQRKELEKQYGSKDAYARALYEDAWANAMPGLELMGRKGDTSGDE